MCIRLSRMLTHIDPTWHACGGALMLLLLFLRRWVCRRSTVLMFLFLFPGYFLHEGLHALVGGLLFRAGICGFNLIPERNRIDGGWTLGSVEFGRVTAFNAVPIALAPLLLLPAAYYGVYRHWHWFFPSPTLLNTLGMYFVMFVLIYESCPSRQDIRIATNWKSLLLYGSIIVVVSICKFRFGF